MCKNTPPTTALLSSLPCDPEHIRDKRFNFNDSTFQFFTVSPNQSKVPVFELRFPSYRVSAGLKLGTKSI